MVADGTVERMVEQKKLHDSLTATLRHLGGRVDVHAGGHVGTATDDGLGNPSDFLVSFRIQHRFTRSAIAHRHAHFDQAHPTVAGHRKLRVITIVRNLPSVNFRGFD